MWSVLTFDKTPFLQFTVFYHEHVFTKDPGTTSTTPWHHDQSYYPVDGWKVKLNEWIAWIVYGHMIRMPDWEGIYCEMQRNWRKKLAWWKEGRGKFYNNYRSWIGLPRSNPKSLFLGKRGSPETILVLLPIMEHTLKLNKVLL